MSQIRRLVYKQNNYHAKSMGLNGHVMSHIFTRIVEVMLSCNHSTCPLRLRKEFSKAFFVRHSYEGHCI